MTEDQFKALRVGDLVRHKLSGDAYVIVDEVRLNMPYVEIVTAMHVAMKEACLADAEIETEAEG